MYYDPIKNRFASVIALFSDLRIAFYWILDLLLLRQAYVKREINRYMSNHTPLRFYDAGAGFCQYSWYILKNDPHATVMATDLKNDYLADFSSYAAIHFPGRFTYQTADLQNYTTANEHDIAVAIDILEHIPDDVAAMHNLYNSLAPGGILIISTPSDLDEAAKYTEEHVRPGYNKADLEQKLSSVGFEISSSRYTYGFWGALSWKLCMKYPMNLISIHKSLALILPLWYLITYPFAFVMMQLDLRADNPRGTGILTVARKSIDK